MFTKMHKNVLLRHFFNKKQINVLRSLFTTSNYVQKQSIYLIDEQKKLEFPTAKVNKYTLRTYTCADLRSKHIAQNVTLCGWLQYNRLNKFLILRDAYGETQIMIKDDDAVLKETIQKLPFESIIKVNGIVVARPQAMINKSLPTGEIEILAENVQVLNRSKEILPFNIREFQKAKESLRMKYRYLDMRFSNMQRNLRVRSKLLMDMRNFLVTNANFIEIETPTLFKATPGGAQEFVVPTRFPGLFYSLVQSPQQFKQMLMAGACDRYFQVARCYRDEGSRPDRQPEFTQLDLELSFTNREYVIALIEDLLNYSWPDFLPQIPEKFKRITYNDAIELYGTDKPDTRYAYTLKNFTDLFENRRDDFGAFALVFENNLNVLTKSVKDAMSNLSKQYPNIKFMQLKYNSEFVVKTSKLIPESTTKNLVKKADLKENDVVFIAFGDKYNAARLLGKIRVDYMQLLRNNGHEIFNNNSMDLLWVVDFPLFEQDENDGQLQSVHHPFTAVHPDDLHLLQESPFKVRSQAYDLVLNGNEIAGGSIRIHNKNQQEEILKLLNIPQDDLKHMLEMLESGCPPHGGIAIGVDRLLAIILNTASIRDVIAFPKTFEGRDPISGAPCPLTDRDKKLYHIVN